MGPLDQIVWFWRWLEGQWRFNVLGFDSETQTILAESMLPHLREDLDASLKTIGGWAQRFQRSIGLGELFSVVILVLIAIAVMALVISIRGRRRRRRCILEQTSCTGISGLEGRRVAAQLSFYVEMLELLRRSGLPKPYWQPPADFAASLGAKHPKVSTVVAEITRWYYNVRYGGRVDGEGGTGRMKDALARLDQALGVRT